MALRLSLAAMAVAAAAAVLVATSVPALAQDAEVGDVTIVDFEFQPGTLDVAVGDAVTCRRDDGVVVVTGSEAEGPPPESSAPREVDVGIADFRFAPAEVAVAPAGTVRFANGGGVDHTATFDDVALDTDVIAAGNSAELIVPLQPGSYSYVCTIHPDRMSAVVVVVGAGQADPTAQAETPPLVEVTGGSSSGGVRLLVVVLGGVATFLAGYGVAVLSRGGPT